MVHIDDFHTNKTIYLSGVWLHVDLRMDTSNILCLNEIELLHHFRLNSHDIGESYLNDYYFDNFYFEISCKQQGSSKKPQIVAKISSHIR